MTSPQRDRGTGKCFNDPRGYFQARSKPFDEETLFRVGGVLEEAADFKAQPSYLAPPEERENKTEERSADGEIIK